MVMQMVRLASKAVGGHLGNHTLAGKQIKKFTVYCSASCHPHQRECSPASHNMGPVTKTNHCPVTHPTNGNPAHLVWAPPWSKSIPSTHELKLWAQWQQCNEVSNCWLTFWITSGKYTNVQGHFKMPVPYWVPIVFKTLWKDQGHPLMESLLLSMVASWLLH